MLRVSSKLFSKTSNKFLNLTKRTFITSKLLNPHKCTKNSLYSKSSLYKNNNVLLYTSKHKYITSSTFKKQYLPYYNSLIRCVSSQTNQKGRVDEGFSSIHDGDSKNVGTFGRKTRTKSSQFVPSVAPGDLDLNDFEFLVDDSESSIGYTERTAKGTGVSSSSSDESGASDEQAKVLFEMIWSELVNEMGLEKMVFPKQIMWLCGAPGAGKTAMTKFIMESQGIESHPIRVGDILNDPSMVERKNRGLLISDREVVKALLKLFLSETYSGKYALVDGFPRTTLQAHCIKLLYDKMLWLRRHFENTQHFHDLRRPVFHITVLYVDESVSVQRQLKRGRESLEYNQRVDRSGVGEITEVRNTDIDARKAHERYRIWNDQLTNCLRVIKEKFPFHFINAEGAEMAVQQSIIKELEYQSSQELADETFDVVRKIPLANEIKKDARHNLVKRLDAYQRNYPKEFNAMVEFMDQQWLPIIKKQALTGHVVIRTEDDIFLSDSENRKLSISMALDILTERGYKVHIEYLKNRVPSKIDLETGDIISFKSLPVLIFNIKWPPPKIRYSVAAAQSTSDGWTDSSLNV